MNKDKSPLILTIDDEQYIRDSFHGFLEDRDFRVIEAENGRIGLQVIEKELPDLVLVDMRMPEMDGLEVLEKVTVMYPDMPIVVVSGAGEIRDVVKALHLGAWDYLMKPIKDLDMLAHTINRALERKQLVINNRLYQEKLEEKVEEQTETLAQTHKELQKSEKQYRTIVETAREGIVILDKANELNFVTKRAAEIFGYTVEDMLNKEMKTFVDQEFVSKFIKNTEALMSGKGGQFDMKFKRYDGSDLWGIVSTNPILDAEGKVTASFAMILDITDRKKAEDELASHKDHLEDIVKQRTEELEKTHRELVEKAHKAGMADIATDIVHNVGNVLTSVKTSVQAIDGLIKNSLAQNFLKANELLRENLDRLEDFILHDEKGKLLLHYYLKIEDGLKEEHAQMQKLSDRIIEMVDAIADIVSAQQSYANVDWLVEEVDLKRIINDAITVMHQQMKTFQVSVRTEFEDTPPIPIQKIKLLHTLINIIKNAGEEMKDLPLNERVLTIELLSDKDDDNSVCIRLKDTGRGIPTENLERVFSYGFTSKTGRHGLGLHSCANYMTEMGGKIWVENNNNQNGATFVLKFRLPSC